MTVTSRKLKLASLVSGTRFRALVNPRHGLANVLASEPGTKATRKEFLYSSRCILIFIQLLRCNKHLLGLGQRIKKSIDSADLIGYQFGVVGVSDGISMGTPGMRYSLQSRDLIADQVETAAGGHHLDGMVVVPGCDKNMPGVLMARRYLISRAVRLRLHASS
jgi:dihydroxyacid dehydratase/phosphogluconate dehydratase